MKANFITGHTYRFFAKLHQWKAMHTLSLTNPEKALMVANAIIADRLIEHITPKGGVFIDVGAQYGAVFSAANSNDPSLTIYAFEADAQKAANLQDVHPTCTIFDIAVSDKEGTATFFVKPDASGYNSLVPNEDSDREHITVRTAPIDSLLPDVVADVIKIDIEGAELGALRGAAKLIERSKPIIMFECILRGTNALGYSAQIIWDWLEARDYEIMTPNWLAHTAPGMTAQAFIDAQEYPFLSHNYFAVPRSKLVETRARAREILGIS